MSCKSLLFSILTLVSISTIVAQNPIVKIDFDQSGRSTAEVGEPDYTPWVVTTSPSTLTANGVTFKVTRVGDKGDALGSNWYKTGIQAPSYARLVCDGISVNGRCSFL